MKSADVSGAIPPQVRSAQAEAARDAGQVTAGGRAGSVARAAAAAAAALQRAAPKGIDRLAQEAARSLSILRPQAARVEIFRGAEGSQRTADLSPDR